MNLDINECGAFTVRHQIKTKYLNLIKKRLKIRSSSAGTSVDKATDNAAALFHAITDAIADAIAGRMASAPPFSSPLSVCPASSAYRTGLAEPNESY